jgi:O-antigen ligase
MKPMAPGNAREIPSGHAGGGLLWSEYWYLAATVIAAAVAVDPLSWGLASDPLIKHLALAVSLPALALTLAGSSLSSRSRQAVPLAALTALLWPLLALAALALGGSLHARAIQDIQNSFLNVGLYMLTAYFAAVMVLRSGAPEALARAHLRILLAAAAVMAVYLIDNFRVRQVYHEQIFLVIPMAVLFFAGSMPALVRWTGCLFFLAMAWVSAKYTSYLIGAATAAYLLLAVVVPRMASRPGLRRMMLVYWIFVLAGAAALGVVMLGLRGTFDLPTGNVEYRMHTYTAAWERFLDSPLWGTLFAVEAVQKFTLYSIGISRNLLATHSDVLDLLANGGLLGIGLWLYALARIARAAHANLLRPEFLDREWAPHAHTLAVVSLAGIITYAFNPIMLQPALAYLMWTSLGMLAGLALRMNAVDAWGGGLPHPAAARARSPRGAYGGVAAAGFNARSRT